MKAGKSVSTWFDTLETYTHFLHSIVGLRPDDSILKSLELYGANSLPDLMNMAEYGIEMLEVTDDKCNSKIIQR